MNIRQLRREAGHTLVEVAVSAAISVALFGAFASSVSGAVDICTSEVASTTLQDEARRVIELIRRDINATGRIATDASGVAMPHVYSNGTPAAALSASFQHDATALAALAATFPPAPAPPPGGASPPPFVAPGSEWTPYGLREYVFRLPQDLDGDGMITSSTTHAIEWSTSLYGWILVPNNTGTLNLVRRTAPAGAPVRDVVVSRNIEAMTFDSVATKNILPSDAVEVHIHFRRTDSRGRIQRLHLATTFAMRNS